MGLFSSITSIIGAGAQKKASKKAEAARIAGQQKGIDTFNNQQDITDSQLDPFIQTGTSALGGLSALLGVSTPGTTNWGAYVQGNPDALANWNAVKDTPAGQQFGGDINKFGEYHYAQDGSRRDLSAFTTGGSDGGAEGQQAAIDQLHDSPMYQSLYRNGEEAVLQNASATGGLRGGNTQRSLYNLGSDTLSQVIQQQIANLGGLSAQGQGAATSAAGIRQGTAGAVADLQNQQGGARASGLLTRGGLTAAQWAAGGGALDKLASTAVGGGFGATGLSAGVTSALGKAF